MPLSKDVGMKITVGRACRIGGEKDVGSEKCHYLTAK